MPRCKESLLLGGLERYEALHWISFIWIGVPAPHYAVRLQVVAAWDYWVLLVSLST